MKKAEPKQAQAKKAEAKKAEPKKAAPEKAEPTQAEAKQANKEKSVAAAEPEHQQGGNWQDLIKAALAKKKPPAGWTGRKGSNPIGSDPKAKKS